MAREARISPADLERLSAYIDRQLSPRQRAEVEARLSAEPELAQALRELEGVVAAVGSIEPMRIPRSFILTPEMVREHRISHGYPLLQFATAVSALAFVALIGFDLLGSGRLAGQMAAPANEQLLFEAAPAMSDEIQQGQAGAGLAVGEGAAEVFAGEATPLPPAALLEEGAPAEPETAEAEDAMKLSATAVPTLSGEARSAPSEPGALEQPAPMLGAELQPGVNTFASATATAEYRAVQSAAPALGVLRTAEILSGALAFLLGLLLIFRYRRTA
jgi:hypothetical protein